MKYISTRGRAPALSFEDAVLAGMAEDGGLFVPESWPRFSDREIADLAGLDYPALAVQVIAPFVGDALGEDELAAMIRDSYARFDDADITPLRRLDDNEWLLELFHGPTLAFKDLALQFLGRLFDHILAKRDARITVIGATSGDTGSAAIEACRDRDRMMIFMLHPAGRVSEVQRRQMTTVMAANVRNIAIDGTFDDCQALVKALFADADVRARLHPAAVNSINWARIMAQVVYYFFAAVKLGAPAHRVLFSVPTGNFGDVFAGYVAARMGLPLAGLIVATNRNDILDRALKTGVYRLGDVQPTLSPSMDIQVSSNFERLLFDLYDRDGAQVAALMADLKREGAFTLSEVALGRARMLFSSRRVDEDETIAMIARTYEQCGVLIDPHTAVGRAAGLALRADPEVPLITLATAHPAKFGHAVERATGRRPDLPPRLADLLARPERCQTLANDFDAVRRYIMEEAGAGGISPGPDHEVQINR